MPKKAARKTSLKNKGFPTGSWWKGTMARPLLLLAALAVVGVVLAVANIRSGAPAGTSRFSYTKDGIGLAFDYPSDFTDDTKPQPAGAAGVIVFQQTRKDPDGAMIGFVRAMYEPVSADDKNNPDSSFGIITNAANGDQSAIKAFQTSQALAYQADCTTHATISTTNNKPMLKCGVPKYMTGLSGDKYTGAVLMGASKSGIYTFEYFMTAQYWKDHPAIWDKIFHRLDFNNQ